MQATSFILIIIFFNIATPMHKLSDINHKSTIDISFKTNKKQNLHARLI